MSLETGWLDYDIVDVFTDRPYAGNPLAVVYGTTGCSPAELLRIAREFNLSETAFPWPASSDAATYRLRICTPGVELPFAGHPSIGAAWAQRSRGLIADGPVVQECGAGLLPLEFRGDEVSLTGGTPTLGAVVPAEQVAAAIGVPPADIVLPPRQTGTGLTFTFAVVREGVVDSCQPVPRLVAALGGAGVSVSSWKDGAAYTRVFAGDVGVDEDPATGSAALGFGVYAVTVGLLPGGGASEVTIRQGVAMGRPSTLHVTVEAVARVCTRATVRGGVVAVANGRIRRPA